MSEWMTYLFFYLKKKKNKLIKIKNLIINNNNF